MASASPSTLMADGIPKCLSCMAEGVTVQADTTIRLALGDRSATADLCADHLQSLQAAFEPLIEAAAGRQRRRPDRTSVPRLRGNEDRGAIRSWALANGLPVARSGGISRAVLERYRAEVSRSAEATARSVS